MNYAEREQARRSQGCYQVKYRHTHTHTTRGAEHLRPVLVYRPLAVLSMYFKSPEHLAPARAARRRLHEHLCAEKAQGAVIIVIGVVHLG